MTQKRWVVSDTHFGHALMVRTRGFANLHDHDETLVDAWNSVVSDGDTVWHLGDVYFRGGWEVLHRLRGDKRCTLGNHDAQKAEALARAGFKLYGMVECSGVLLSHMPVHPAQLRRFRLNVHGHTHASRVFSDVQGVPDRRYVPVSVEHLPGWKPILLQTAIQHGVPDESGSTNTVGVHSGQESV